MSAGHQSPQSSLPPLAFKTINTVLWGASSNALTVTDEYVHPNSVIVPYVTGAVPAAGRWSIAVSQGSFVITSTDGESSTLPVSYIVL